MSPTERGDRRDYGLRPLLLDAAAAHREGRVVYADDGTVTLTDPRLPGHGLPSVVTVPPARQFPAARATLADLDKALSRAPASPRMEEGVPLRDLFDAELSRYRSLEAEARSAGRFEPDWGSYVYDHHRGDLYLVAPERWHRLALVASNAMLLTDPEASLSFAEVRSRLEGAVVGFAGLSVGGNLVEGWLREARPRAVKLADPDHLELTNFNRGERMSLRHLVQSRASRPDPKNPDHERRVLKADYLAYECQLVDPYLDAWVYPGGLDGENLGRFLSGDGGDEPPIDILVEETDRFEIKVMAREAARARRIDVLMLSDFGNTADLMWNHFRQEPRSRLGFGAEDAELHEALSATRGGDRARVFAFVEKLCGPLRLDRAFAAFAAGGSDQPISKVPQSGGTVMASGAIGGKELAHHVLGHHHGEPSPRRVVYDLASRMVIRA